jgi:hypothetical protein
MASSIFRSFSTSVVVAKIRFLNSEPDDKPLGVEALRIMAASRVADLREQADSLSSLFDGMNEGEVERLLVMLFGDHL